MLIMLPALVLRTSLSRGAPSPWDVAVLRITAPLEAAVSWVVEGIGGAWSSYVALVDVERENRELRADNAVLRDQLSVMTRRAFDASALEDLVAVKHTRTADTLGARVIGAPLTPQFRVLRLQLDRGDREVRPGQAVIGDGGPIGAIDKVYGSYADVVLISDPASSIEVVVPRTGGRGIVTGLGRSDSYACKLEWLERSQKVDARVVVGDDVVTTGLGATFPAGLVVGKVSKIVHDDGMFQEVEIEPAVDVSRVRAALVLLSSDAAADPDAKAKKKSEPAFGARPL
jgi:rod shape-determining protein MreC